METLTPVGPAEQTPVPQKSSVLKWLIIGLVVLAVGLAAYLVAGSKLFKGELQLAPADKADQEMNKVRDYIGNLPGIKGFNSWPITTGGETSFGVLNNDDQYGGLFWSPKGYGTWRSLHVAFKIKQPSSNTVVITGVSLASGTAVTNRCIKIMKEGSLIEEECSKTKSESFTVDTSEYAPGEYTVLYTINDGQGRQDAESKNFTVAAPEQPAEAEVVDIQDLVCLAEVSGHTAAFTTDSSIVKINDGPANLNDSNKWKWEWNFGDGQTSTEKNLVHIYPQIRKDKTYNVSVKLSYKKNESINKTASCSVTIKAKDDGAALTAPADTRKTEEDNDNDILDGGNIPKYVPAYKIGPIHDLYDSVLSIDVIGNNNIEVNRVPELFDWLSADIGTTVYFEAGCQADKGVVHIAKREFTGDSNIHLQIASAENSVGRDTIADLDINASTNERCPGPIITEGVVEPVVLVEPTISLSCAVNDTANADGTYTATITTTMDNLPEGTIGHQWILNGTPEGEIVWALPAASKEITIDPTIASELMLEDAEDGDTLGWTAYNDEASIINTYENEKQEKVIVLKNTLLAGGFSFGKKNDTDWNNSTNKIFSFDLNSENNVQIALNVETSQGNKYLEYHSKIDKSKAIKNYIYIKLDNALLDGNWHTIVRDLQADANSILPGITIDKIKFLQIWWNGKTDNVKIDNIKLFNPDPTSITSSYQVGLDVQDANGKTWSATTTCNIPAPQTPQQPTVDFTATPNTGNAPLNVQFVDSTDPKGQDLSGTWDFGDGSPTAIYQTSVQTSKMQAHIYNNVGTYTAKLMLTNTDKSFSGEKSATITVTQGGGGGGQLATQCSDGKDNDKDGLFDTKDPGCDDSKDNDETNIEENVKEGKAKIPACLMLVKPQEFADIESVVNKNIIEAESGTAYDGEDKDLVGKVIFEGYFQDEEKIFKPYYPIRRDEAVKTVLITTCYMDDLIKKDDLNKKKVAFKDEAFSHNDYWAADYIYMAANAGLVEEKNKFHPEKAVTRAEFLKLLLEVYADVNDVKIPECTKTTKIKFVDVDKDDWFCKYAVLAKTLGISEGFKAAQGKLHLNPDKILTRTDAAVMLWNYYVAATGKKLDEKKK